MRDPKNGKRFKEISDGILDTIWRSCPVAATLYGIHEYDHTIGDVSADAFREYALTFRNYAEALLAEVDVSQMDKDEEIDYHMAVSFALSNNISLELQRPWMNDPSLYASLCIWGCYSLITRESTPLDDRMRSILSRLREIPDALQIAQSNITNPSLVHSQVALEVTQGGSGFFRYMIPEAAALTPSLQADVLKANEAAISAFENYERWLLETVIPNADGDFAVGHEVYEQLISVEHLLEYSPSDLVTLGEKVLADAQKEIQKIARTIDPNVTWQELVCLLKQDHPDKHSLLEAYRDEIQRAKTFVMERGLVAITAGEKLDVRETPQFERSTIPYAAYFPPAPFGGDRIGHFWVTPVDDQATQEDQESQLLGHCRYTIPIIALHEGYPGHHLQLTRSLDLKSRLRKQAMNSLLIEGWALYCEELMYEEGFYTDPRVRLFQLKDLIWRACRVIIDVGLHTGEMTFDEAVRMLVDTAHLEEINAVAEVKRYAMSPTQPMTYIIGKMIISDLRDQLKQKLGNRFCLKEFHNQLLSYGSIPPSLIALSMLD